MLLEWINSTLKPEHIVVQSLEEDLYDGLVLHHLLCEFSGVNQSSLESPASRCSCECQLLIDNLNFLQP